MVGILVLFSTSPFVGAQAPERVVKNGVLQLVTGDDGKDDTDVLSVTVANADGKILERVYDAKEEIKPSTTFNAMAQSCSRAAAGKGEGQQDNLRHQPQMG